MDHVLTPAEALLKTVLKRQFAPRRSTKGSRTELAQPLRWYRDTYGISFNTVRRHRAWLDRPRELLVKLLWNRGPQPNLMKLSQYLKTHE